MDPTLTWIIYLSGALLGALIILPVAILLRTGRRPSKRSVTRRPAQRATASPVPTPIKCPNCGVHLPPPRPDATTVYCDYCRHPIVVNLDRSKTAPADEDHPASDRARGLLILSPFLILFSLVFLVGTITGYRYYANRYTRFTQAGVSATARITRLSRSTKDDYVEYYVHYRYQAQVNGRPQSIDTTVQVYKKEYLRYHEGQPVTIRYVASDPYDSVLADTLAPPSQPLYLGLGIFAGLLLITGVGIFLYGLSQSPASIHLPRF